MTYQVQCVKDLQFSDRGMSGVSQVAMIRIRGESTHSVLVGRRLSDGVQDLHVADVVDEKRFLKANDQSLRNRINIIKRMNFTFNEVFRNLSDYY